EHHDEIGEAGRDECVGVADADGARGAHVLGARAQRARADAERLRGHRRDVALERRPLGHDRSDHESFDVFWLHGRYRIEARLARFPDEVAVRRLAHAELRHARADERDLSHDVLPTAAAPSRASAIATWPDFRANSA